MPDLTAFLTACRNTLDADADHCHAIAEYGFTPEHGEWLMAHTVDLDPDPSTWAPEYREIWVALLDKRI